MAKSVHWLLIAAWAAIMVSACGNSQPRVTVLAASSLQDVVPAAEIVKIVAAELPCDPVDPNYPGEVARRYRYRDGSGEFGVIASVTQPFCGACTRLRLSAEGSLYTCLFATEGHDLRDLVRAGTNDDDLGAFIDGVWKARNDRYSEIRSSETRDLPKVEMSYIGG